MKDEHDHDGAGDGDGAAGDDHDHHPKLLTVSGSDMVEVHPAVCPTSPPATQSEICL